MLGRLDRSYDVIVVGGGIVGLATARALQGLSVLVVESEPKVAAHQTGHNSGVIHAGLYYKPGSEKARHCSTGRSALYDYCMERSIPYERCGKVVVATHAKELATLDDLERRGLANGLVGIRRLCPEEVTEIEPHAVSIAGLHVPMTGIVDYGRVATEFANDVREFGTVATETIFRSIRRENGGIQVETTSGSVRCRVLVGCAGLYADRVARTCGVDPKVRIVPFRGEYYKIVEERRNLVRHLIYPVPDPRFPFLGVHFTRRIGGEIEAGPNAVLALKRTGYRKGSFSPRDAWATLAYPGFWKLASRHLRTGAAESWRSFSKRAFVASLRKLVPEIGPSDIARAGAGVRAQALGPDGSLLDDFSVVEASNMVHVLNAPSPAATASMSIGRSIARRVRSQFDNA